MLTIVFGIFIFSSSGVAYSVSRSDCEKRVVTSMENAGKLGQNEQQWGTHAAVECAKEMKQESISSVSNEGNALTGFIGVVIVIALTLIGYLILKDKYNERIENKSKSTFREQLLDLYVKGQPYKTESNQISFSHLYVGEPFYARWTYTILGENSRIEKSKETICIKATSDSATYFEVGGIQPDGSTLHVLFDGTVINGKLAQQCTRKFSDNDLVNRLIVVKNTPPENKNIRPENLTDIPNSGDFVQKKTLTKLLSKLEEMTVSEIAKETGKTERGVRTYLTRNGLRAKDYQNIRNNN